jgi:hypothetical protein
LEAYKVSNNKKVFHATFSSHPDLDSIVTKFLKIGIAYLSFPDYVLFHWICHCQSGVHRRCGLL